MANLSEIANAMFRYRNKWSEISDKDKELNAFIFTRYFSKMYPETASKLNNKTSDKVVAMNLWYSFMNDKPYPGWFWKGPTKSKTELSNKDFRLLMDRLKIDKEGDLKMLMKWYPDMIQEELKYYKKKEKK